MDRSKRKKYAPLILLGGIVVSGTSTFMIYPLLLFRLRDVGLGFGEIGLILGLLSGTGRLCSFAIGTSINKLGSKLTVCTGLALRVIGISVFAFNTSTGVYAICAALASIGASSAALGIKTELLRISASRKYITMRSMAINSGAIVGPALGALLYHFLSFHVILYVSMAAYSFLVVLFLFTSFSAPEGAVIKQQGKQAHAKSLLPYIGITLVAALYWAIYSQWSIVVPLLAERAFGHKEASDLVFIANAVIVLALQYPLLVVLLRSVRDKTILLAGFFSFFVAFASLLFDPSLLTVAIFACVFSLSELLVSPTLDSQTAQLAPAHLGLTRAYGFQDTLTGIFSIGGATLGGWLIAQFSGTHGSALLELPVAVVAMVVILVMRKKEKQV